MLNNFRLPKDYNVNIASGAYLDGHNSLDGVTYQEYVYKAAFHFVKRTNAKYIIDIGCGDGRKIINVKNINHECRIIMIDSEFVIDNITSKYDFAQYLKADLEQSIPDIGIEILEDSVVICSDVIEHLRDPSMLLNFFHKIKDSVHALVISTPDRCQERGVFDYGPPANPFHVREWNLDEFCMLLNDYGFSNKILAGLTVSNSLNNSRATIVTIASKYFTSENKISVEIENIDCPKINIGKAPSRKIKEFFKDVDLVDTTWYLLGSSDYDITAPNLRYGVSDIINSADKYGFNCVLASELSIEGCGDSWVGEVFMENSFEKAGVGAIRGDALKGLMSSNSFELVLFPINIIRKSMKKMSFLDRFLNLGGAQMKLGYWHESITRKDFILELAFGAGFYEK